MKFLNPTALDMMVKADAVTEHVMKMYFQIKDQVKARLAIDALSLKCTCDVWTSPNNGQY